MADFSFSVIDRVMVPQEKTLGFRITDVQENKNVSGPIIRSWTVIWDKPLISDGGGALSIYAKAEEFSAAYVAQEFGVDISRLCASVVFRTNEVNVFIQSMDWKVDPDDDYLMKV